MTGVQTCALPISIGAICFVDKSTKLVFSTFDNQIKVVDVNSGRLHHYFNNVGYPNRIVSRGDGHVVVAGTVGYLKNKGWQRISFSANSGRPKAIVFSPDNKYVVTAGEDKLVQIWDGKSFKLLKTLKAHTEYGNALAFSPDSKQLIAGGGKLITIWDFWKINKMISGGGK